MKQSRINIVAWAAFLLIVVLLWVSIYLVNQSIQIFLSLIILFGLAAILIIFHKQFLRKEKETAQKYLDVAGVMIVVINADQRVGMINKMGCKILGYDDEREIIGKNWFDYFIPHNNTNEAKKSFNKIISSQEESVEHHDNPVITKDKKERIISWHNTVMRDKRGRVQSILSSGEDVTERKRLKQEQELFFNVSLDMICIATLEG